MTDRRSIWDFGYEPRPVEGPLDDATGTDVVIATREPVDAGWVRAALRSLCGNVEVDTLLNEAPLFWTRVRCTSTLSPDALNAALARGDVAVRYVTSARAPSMVLPPRLEFSKVPAVRPAAWHVRARRPVSATYADAGDWFLGGGAGVHVDRGICGTGSGTRLAVIDDETADLEQIELERVIHVGVDQAPATSGHAALMVGWAVGAVRPGGERFVGVAPDASVRVYCIPKPGEDVVSLPLALARAVLEGADVVVCATYLGGGTTSPMLDDALDVAAHLGRRGRGTVVVLPTGREASSPGCSVHASLSLGMSDPASDLRVQCVAPGGRQGGWFLWRTARGALRPFSNRGPAVRWLAPGDDIAYPLASRDQLFHAESSGASAIAAGVVLLVLGCNPKLRLHELHAILARTVDRPEANPGVGMAVVDPADLLPCGYDRDGHNARTGYGRLNATAACLSARDPIALALVAVGEDEAAARWCAQVRRPYSRRTARWAARALLARPDLEHGARSLARHVRLIAAKPSRARAHASGALARQLGILGRELGRMHPPPFVQRELGDLERAIAGDAATANGANTALEHAALAIFADSGGERGTAAHAPVSVTGARS